MNPSKRVRNCWSKRPAEKNDSRCGSFFRRPLRHRPCWVLATLWALLFLFVKAADGEPIYRWESGKGEVFYSNVSPPAQVVFHVIHFQDTSENAARSEGDTGNGSADEKRDVLSAAGISESSHASRFQLLTQRIAERKKEIDAIERLLITRATDERLRRNLMRKKRYLAEERKCLAELNL